MTQPTRGDWSARIAARCPDPCPCAARRLGCVVALLFIRVTDARRYAARIKSGKWHYGAVIFPGGDVVMRDVLPCGRTEVHVERMHLQRASVRLARSWRTMFLLQPHIVLRRTELTGETREFAFPESAFTESAHHIVACINGSNSRGNGGGADGGNGERGESGAAAVGDGDNASADAPEAGAERDE